MLTTGLHNIVLDTAQIYTSEIFKEVKNDILKSSVLIVFEWVEVDDRLMFKLTKTFDTRYCCITCFGQFKHRLIFNFHLLRDEC